MYVLSLPMPWWMFNICKVGNSIKEMYIYIRLRSPKLRLFLAVSCLLTISADQLHCHPCMPIHGSPVGSIHLGAFNLHMWCSCMVHLARKVHHRQIYPDKQTICCYATGWEYSFYMHKFSNISIYLHNIYFASILRTKMVPMAHVIETPDMIRYEERLENVQFMPFPKPGSGGGYGLIRGDIEHVGNFSIFQYIPPPPDSSFLIGP